MAIRDRIIEIVDRYVDADFPSARLGLIDELTALIAGVPSNETLAQYKRRNNERRDEDDPGLRGAVDDIYRLIGWLENRVTTTDAESLQSQLEQLRAENERLNAIVSAYENQDEEALEEAENL